MKKYLLLCSILFCSVSVAFSLTEAWQAARTHSARYDAAIHERNASFEIQEQAKAQMLPQVNASASFNNQFDNSPSSRRDYGWRVEAKQSLFDLSKKRQYEVGEVVNHLAESTFTEVDTELLIRVADSYLSILTVQDKLIAVATEKAAYEMQIQQAKALYDAGQATVIDTYEAQSGYDAAVAKETALTTQLIVAQNTLGNMTGLDPRNIDALPQKNLPDWAGEKTEEAWLEEAFLSNPSLHSYEKRLEKSQIELQAAESTRYPNLDFTLGYKDFHTQTSYEGLSSSNKERERGLYIGLQLSIPVYTSGLMDSRVRQEQETMQQQASLLREEHRNIILQIRQSYAELKGKHAQMTAQKRLLATNIAKLESIQLGRDYGIRNNMDEVKARQDKANAEEQLAQAQYDYIGAYLKLLNVAGQLNTEEGEKIVFDIFSN